MRIRTVIALAGICAAAGIGIAVHLALTLAPPRSKRASLPAPVSAVPQGASAPGLILASGEPLPKDASRPAVLPFQPPPAPGALDQTRGQSAANTRFAPSQTPDALSASGAEKTVTWRIVGPGDTAVRSAAPADHSTDVAFHVPGTSISPRTPGQQDDVPARHQTAAGPAIRGASAATPPAESADDGRGLIAVRFFPTEGKSGGPDPARASVRYEPSVRSPVAPDDSTLLRRSIEEFRTLRRPLDHVSVRYYTPRHLTVEQLQTLIAPLLTENTGQSHRVPSGRQASQNAGNSDAHPALAVRDRLEVLDRLDRVVPLLDVAPAYVTFEAMVLDIRLSGSGGVDFQRLIQKRHLAPAEHVPRAAGNAPASSDGPGLKVAYLNGQTNGLLEAVGAFGTATLLATPRVAVRQGAEVEIELDAVDVADRQPTDPPAPADRSPLTGIRLFLRPVTAYEGGMDVQVRVARQGTASQTAGLANPRAPMLRSEDPDAEREQASVFVVPESVTLVIGGLARPHHKADGPSDRPGFLGMRPFWSRPGTDRHELLVLVACSAAGAPHAEVARAMESLDSGLRRVVAQQYLRAAERAQHARQNALALQWAEQALRFDGAEPPVVRLCDRLQRTASASPRTAWR